jgi:hypothetical protein
MSRPQFLSGLLDMYNSVIRHTDDQMIIVTHWCFIRMDFRVIEEKKVKTIYKTNLLLLFFARQKIYSRSR